MLKVRALEVYNPGEADRRPHGVPGVVGVVLCRLGPPGLEELIICNRVGGCMEEGKG